MMHATGTTGGDYITVGKYAKLEDQAFWSRQEGLFWSYCTIFSVGAVSQGVKPRSPKHICLVGAYTYMLEATAVSSTTTLTAVAVAAATGLEIGDKMLLPCT